MGYWRGTHRPAARFLRSDGTHPWQKQWNGPLSREQQRVDELAALVLEIRASKNEDMVPKSLSTIVNEQAWVIWMPVQLMRAPVRSRFGNVRPSSVSSSASSIVWNAEEFFVKPQAQATN